MAGRFPASRFTPGVPLIAIHENILNLIERLGRSPAKALDVSLHCVPIIDEEVLQTLIGEAFKATQGDGDESSIIALDGYSAQALSEAHRLVAGQEITIFGESPEGWEDGNVSQRELGDLSLKRSDRVCVILSPSVRVALFGSVVGDGDADHAFEGGWSMDRTLIASLAQTVFEEIPSALNESVAPSEIAASGTVMRLMAVHANSLLSRERSIAKDNDDLSSVLEILKAISAKRRAHDVLFVFVERISSVISSKRCSIVRIWGGDRHGHVLASHEDQSVTEQNIDLDKYPELLRSMEVRDKVVVNNVQEDSLTKPFAESLVNADITAILVIPIVLFDENVGSLFLRAARGGEGFSERETNFFEIVAEAAANALERAQLFEDIQSANEHLERLAITDGLTGLYNHRHFRDRLDEEFERAKRYNLSLSCLIFDVDSFKAFNDQHGHLVGDHILREIARRTLFCIRNSDFVARYGGEEFVIILPQTNAGGAVSEAERLLDAIRSKPFDVTNVTDGVRVTVSVGVGTLDGSKMENSEDILKIADDALYEAKKAGKNCVFSFAQ